MITSAPLWRDRAAALTRTLCAILGADPACVYAVPDPERTYELFGYSDIRLIVTDTLLDTDPGADPETDPGEELQAKVTGRLVGCEYEFIPGRSAVESNVAHLLRPCPGCAQLVPTYRIGELADLGQIILNDRAGRAPLPPDSQQFSQDAAHLPGCIYRSPTQPWPR